MILFFDGVAMPSAKARRTKSRMRQGRCYSSVNYLYQNTGPFCELCRKGEVWFILSPTSESHFPAPVLGLIDNVCQQGPVAKGGDTKRVRRKVFSFLVFYD